MTVRICPSILNANFMTIGQELDAISTADLVHVDVMDNHFVPNLTFGTSMVEQIAAATALKVDAHLMIEDADRWAPAYAEAGAASVTFHAEAAKAPIRLARTIRELGARAGIAVRPATPIEPYLEVLAELDMVLIMTVEPGFGGQSFIESMLPKIQRARKAIDASGHDVWLQVDGGISADTIKAARDAGADTFVAGSSVYKADSAKDAIAHLRKTAQGRKLARGAAPGGVALGGLCPSVGDVAQCSQCSGVGENPSRR